MPISRLIPAALLALIGQCLPAQESTQRLIRETDARSAEDERAGFHVPEGFSVQLFAAEPMINKPINLAFDARGRLWVSSTVEYPYAAARERWTDDRGTRVQDSRDAIKILEDTDGDGRADRVIDFADGLNIPTGVLPWHKPEHQDGCIAWSIPNIWYFADTDGDGRADLREVLFGPLGFEKDTHGMCSSFRLGLDGWVYATHGFNNTSHFKATDGSTLDLNSGNVFRFRPDGSHVEIWSWGQVNPFGLCWDRHNNLYSADCHSNPITQLIHGAYYPSFGKPHDGLGFGPVMCAHSHGSTGLCGIVYIDGGVWGPEWDDRMLLGNCVTSKVNHDRITFTGATPKANEEPDFITSDDPWFRPVDLQLGPDGALYIADFYNKIIGHYEVPLDHPGRDRERGRIWRVVKSGASRKAQRANVHAPSRIEDLASRDAMSVKTAAAWFSEHPSRELLPPLSDALHHAQEDDLQLRHQLRIALRNCLALEGAYASLPASAHDDLPAISLAVPTADAAAFLLQESATPDLPVLTHIARYGTPDTVAQMVAAARQRGAQDVAALAAIHNGLQERGMAAPKELLAWAMQLAENLLSADRPDQSHWTYAGSGENPFCLQERKCADGETAQVISSLNKDLRGPEKLTGTLRSAAFAAPEKLAFWICGHQGFPNEEANRKNLVRLVDERGETLQQAFPPRNDVCQRVEWDLAPLKGNQVRLEIVDGDDGKAYAWLGVTRIDPAVADVGTFQSDDARQKGLRVLAGLLQHTAPAALREKLSAHLPPRPAPPPLPVSVEQRQQLDALIKSRAEAYAAGKPDAAKGKALFATNCAVCHQIGGEGGLVGPQLDGIKNRGVERLCEDILDPNRNVDAHFHLHALKTKGGEMIAGFLRGEYGEVVELIDAAGQPHRVSKGDIAEEQISPMTIMPPTFGQTLAEKDFVDLLGWLMTR